MKNLALPMNTDVSVFAGMPVVVSKSLPYDLPVRSLIPRPWHRRTCYQSRVNKKWLKRFGVVKINTIRIAGQLLISPKIWEEMRRDLKELKP